ncbi:hypothetical protein Tco_0168012 [Tanacetum coccineum]
MNQSLHHLHSANEGTSRVQITNEEEAANIFLRRLEPNRQKRRLNSDASASILTRVVKAIMPSSPSEDVNLKWEVIDPSSLGQLDAEGKDHQILSLDHSPITIASLHKEGDKDNEPGN